MAKKELFSMAVVSVIVFRALLLVLSILFATTPFALSNSTGLSSAPIIVQTLGAGLFGLDGSALADFGYEVCALLNTTQGLPSPTNPLQGVFNPGADLDFTTTTDFEDLAAPVADIIEFTDQDRALAVDYVSSAALFNGVVGGGAGIALYFVLSTSLWRNIF